MRSSLQGRRSRAWAARRRDRQVRLQLSLAGDGTIRGRRLSTASRGSRCRRDHPHLVGVGVRPDGSSGALTHCRWKAIILMIFIPRRGLSDDGTNGGSSGPGDGDLRLRPLGGGDPRRLGSRCAQGRASRAGRSRSRHRGVGRASRGQRRVAPVGGDQPGQAGDRARRRHARGPRRS